MDSTARPTRRRFSFMRISGNEVVVVLVGQILQLVVGIGTSALIGHALHADGYGVVNVLRSLFLMVAIVSPLGLDIALLKHIGKEAAHDPVVGAVSKKLRLLAFLLSTSILAIVALAASFGLFGRVYRFDDADLLFVISFLALPFATDTAILIAVYRARGLAARYALFGPYLQSALRLILVPLAMVYSPHVTTIVWINTLQFMVTAVVLIVDLTAREKPTQRRAIAAVPAAVSREGALGILRESGWMASSILVYSLMRSADIMFLGASAHVASIGPYVALATIAQLITVFPMAASQSLGPAVAKAYHSGDRAGVLRELNLYLQKSAPVSGYLFAGIAVFGQRLDLVFGPSFHFDPTVCLLLPLGQVLSATLGPMGYSLSMTGRHRAENAILITGGIVLGVLCAVFIPQYGAVAAAAVVAFSFTLVNVLRFIVVTQVLGAVPGSWRDVMPAPVGLVLAYAVKWFFDRIGPGDLAHVFVACLIYTALFAAVTYKFFFTEALRGVFAPSLFARGQAR